MALPAWAVVVYNSSGLLDHYRHADWMGSSRLASTTSQTVYSDVSYAPYGEPYNQYGTADLSFTGQNQDTASGLYDFLYREQSSVQGRWISPNPLGMGAANPVNPQSWNRYAYVGNNPLSMIDPLGQFLGLPKVLTTVDVIGYLSPYEGDTGGGFWFPTGPTGLLGGFGEQGGRVGGKPANRASLTPKGQGCQQKVQAAVNNALGTNATYEGPTAGLNDLTYGAGWRNGAYNFNFFAAGYTGSTSPGNCGRFSPNFTGIGPSLRIIVPGGGCNPGGDPYINPTGIVTINGQTGFQFTAHIDSAYGYSPFGAIWHFIADVLFRSAHGC